MDKLVSIIILNWNGESFLRNCLSSVANQDYQPIEIILVDNGSTDNSLDIVRMDFPDIVIIETGKNIGFAAGNNIGIHGANGQYIVIFNNDAEMERSCISEMVCAIEKDDRYGACASKILLKFEKGILDAAGIAICNDGLSIGRGRLEQVQHYDREEEVFFASGCCMLCRRDMLDDVRVGEDFFDESFFMYADDTDLGWRARLRAWKTIYTPNAIAYHLHSASSESYSPLKAFLVERNRICVLFTYFPWWMIIRGQIFTTMRYLYQAYGAFSGKGAAGGFTKSYPKMTLIKILFGAWGGALKRFTYIMTKRRFVQKRRLISDIEIAGFLRKYSVSAKAIGLKG
jgi:GT2 family glycosyltransferase